MFADYHVHTAFSDDSVYPMEDVIRDAVRMGMEEICITDHVDYGIKEDWDCGKEILYRNGEPLANVDYPRYMEKLKELQRLYGDQIQIRTGMEFGVQMHTIPQFDTLFKRYPFDFIILSIHQVEDKEFWTQDFQRGRSQKGYNERYYQEMLDVVKAYKEYSVLGHVDLIVRYDEQGIYPFEKVEPMIREIFQVAIADGKGIELNTSYHRYGLKDTTPSVKILELYRELGGEIVTLGTDAHSTEFVGCAIRERQELLRRCGLRHFYTFENRRPLRHAL